MECLFSALTVIRFDVFLTSSFIVFVQCLRVNFNHTEGCSVQAVHCCNIVLFFVLLWICRLNVVPPLCNLPLCLSVDVFWEIYCLI